MKGRCRLEEEALRCPPSHLTPYPCPGAGKVSDLCAGPQCIINSPCTHHPANVGFCLCNRLNVCVPQNLYVEILTATVMVLEGGGFGKCLGHESEDFMNGISAFMTGIPESSLVSSTI